MEKTLLNLIPGACSPEVHLSQYDKGRAVPFKLAEGKSAYSVPDGSEIVVQATKPSGLGFVVPVTFDGDTATMTITETMSNEYGRFPAELSITNNGNRIGTANFVMNIERSPHPEGTIDGDAESLLPELTLLVERVEAAASSVLDMQVVVNTRPAGSQATYSYDESLNKATFGIPQGEPGAGAVGTVASAYDASKTYAVGDYVIHNNNLYRCITAITNAEAFTASHWTRIVLADDVTDLKTDLNGLSYDTIEQVFEHDTNTPYYASTSNGYRLTDDGHSQVNADYKIMKFNAKAGDLLRIETSDKFQFQDAFVVPSSGTTHQVGHMYGGGVTFVIVPQGALYVVCSTTTETTANVKRYISKVPQLEANDSFILNVLNGNYKYSDLSFDFISKKLLSSNGTISDFHSTDWKVSDYVDVSNYEYIHVEGSTGYSNLYYAKYDANKTFISGQASGGAIDNYANDIYVGDAKYVVVSKVNSGDGAVKQIVGITPRKWTGLKWACIGDSLTQKTSASPKNYFEYIAEETGIIPTNHGLGGTGYANPNGTAGNFASRMADVPTDADVYTIFGSFNDYQFSLDNNLPIGDPTDSGTSSICGYINDALDALFTRVPLANLGVIAPCPWGGVNAISPSQTAKDFGDDYTEAIKLCCERKSIPFLNLYTESGLRPWDSNFRSGAYSNDATGTHPDAVGHEILATKIEAFLDSLLMH